MCEKDCSVDHNNLNYKEGMEFGCKVTPNLVMVCAHQENTC